MTLLGTPIYLLNNTIGIILLLIVTIAAAIVPIQTILSVIGIPAESGLTNEQIAPFVPIALTFFPIMTSTTSASISLEGKRLGLLASLPVSSGKIYLAKLSVNLIISVVPALLAGIVFAIRLAVDPLVMVLCIALPVVCSVYVSLFGLVVNLALPKLDWTTEIQVVKQSASTMATVFSGMLIVGLALVSAFVVGATVTSIVFLAVLVIATVILTILIQTWGKERLLVILS